MSDLISGAFGQSWATTCWTSCICFLRTGTKRTLCFSGVIKNLCIIDGVIIRGIIISSLLHGSRVCLKQNPNFFPRKSGRRLLIIFARAGKKEGGLGEGIFARLRFSAAEFRANFVGTPLKLSFPFAIVFIKKISNFFICVFFSNVFFHK